MRSLAGAFLRAPAVRRVVYSTRRAVHALGMRTDPRAMHRAWSNDQLRQIGILFTGDVVNVSGWRDDDRGQPAHKYREYFPEARSYALTNYPGTRGLADEEGGSIPVDLEAPMPADLAGRFDVVFCHTVLEHVLNVDRAFDALADLTRDITILVVPFMQDQHCDEGAYGDYWRFTPTALDGMLRRRGLSTVYVAANDQPWYPIYLFHVASRQPDAWRGRLPAFTIPAKLGQQLYPW